MVGNGNTCIQNSNSAIRSISGRLLPKLGGLSNNVPASAYQTLCNEKVFGLKVR